MSRTSRTVRLSSPAGESIPRHAHACRHTYGHARSRRWDMCIGKLVEAFKNEYRHICAHALDVPSANADIEHRPQPVQQAAPELLDHHRARRPLLCRLQKRESRVVRTAWINGVCRGRALFLQQAGVSRRCRRRSLRSRLRHTTATTRACLWTRGCARSSSSSWRSATSHRRPSVGYAPKHAMPHADG